MITINEKSYEIPKTWNDLSLKQLIACYSVIMHPFTTLLPAGEEMIFKRIELTKIILELDDDFMLKWKADCLQADKEDGELIFEQELQEVAKVITDFAFELLPKESDLDPDQYKIGLTLTNCPWPLIENTEADLYNQKYHAPADELENLTLYELGSALLTFERFVQEEDEDYADELIAILYRPPKQETVANLWSDYQGDKRLPYYKHESTVKKRKEYIKKLPQAVKQIILFWFASCREQIIKDYENIFVKEKGKKMGGNDYAYAGLILQLANGIANVDQVATSNFHNAFTYLSMLEDQRKQREIEEQMKRLNR
ncbi:MAG: hypothetical protein AAFO07_28745 [Bacteroidota bacterium]